MHFSIDAVRKLIGFTLAAGAPWLAGCRPSAWIELHQPSAPAAQRQMRLESDWAATTEDQALRRCVLDFPLPGSKSGPRDFRCYLSLPAGEGVFSIGEGSPARGFLVQEVGLRRGKTLFRSGTVTVDSPMLKPDRLAVELDIGCDDGTRITGRAVLQVDGILVQRFAQAYAADIASLSDPVAAAPRVVSDEIPSGQLPGAAEPVEPSEAPVEAEPASRPASP